MIKKIMASYLSDCDNAFYLGAIDENLSNTRLDTTSTHCHYTGALNNWPNYSHHIFSTIQLTILGLVMGIVVGLTVAVILHLLPKVREAVYPIMILSQNVPIIVLAPLLVIWFGFGMTPKLLIIILVCFFSDCSSYD